MYFSAKLFSIKDDEVLYLEGNLYDDTDNPLWDEVEDYEAQLKEHMREFVYQPKLKTKDVNRYITYLLEQE